MRVDDEGASDVVQEASALGVTTSLGDARQGSGFGAKARCLGWDDIGEVGCVFGIPVSNCERDTTTKGHM